VHSEPFRATPGDACEVTGGQGVAGSNPAVPTGSLSFFEYISSLPEPVKEPSPFETALLEARADQVSRRSTRAFVNSQRQGSRPVKGSKIASPRGAARRPRRCEPAGTIPAHQIDRPVVQRCQERRTASPRAVAWGGPGFVHDLRTAHGGAEHADARCRDDGQDVPARESASACLGSAWPVRPTG
jgi:hypothetical protein